MTDENHGAREDYALVDIALERLFAIDWSNPRENEDKETSGQAQRMLFYEHFRRMWLWHQEICPNEELSRFFDLPSALAPMPRLVREHLESVWSPYSRQLDYWTRENYHRYLHWVSLFDLPEVQTSLLPCPYEPIIRFYERGGHYAFHHGDVNMSLNGGEENFSLIHPRLYGPREPLLELDDGALDEAARVRLADYDRWIKYQDQDQRI